MVDSVDTTSLEEEMMAELGDFIPAQPPGPVEMSPNGDQAPPELRPAADPEVEQNLPDPGDDLFVLTNLRFINETIFLPDPTGREVSGEYVQFQDGHLITDRSHADFVLAAAPHVYEEPKTGFVFGPHKQTGFRTRSAAGWELYNELLAQNS